MTQPQARSRAPSLPRPGRRAALLALGVVAVAVIVGCGGGAAPNLVTYQRDWPDGFHEEMTVAEDGKVLMRHGASLERVALTSDQVRILRDAIDKGLPRGDQGDSLVRTVILANGTIQTPVRPEAGSSVDMLETLMSTHSFGGQPAVGDTPPPGRSTPPTLAPAPA